MGNIKREDLYQLVFDLVSAKKIPILLGGDHSITTIALQAMSDFFGKMGLAYLMLTQTLFSSATDYYGSVLTDSSRCIDFGKSM